MAYTIRRNGRPRQTYKVRRIEAITPRGFAIHQVKKDEIIFKRKA